VKRFEWERALRSSDVTGSALLVLLVLGTHMDGDGTNGRPSQATLAAETGLSKRSVRQYLADAVDAGWLVQVSRGHRRGDGTTAASCYSTSQPAAGRHLSVVSTGDVSPLEDDLNRQDPTSQPAESGASTGDGLPPTNPTDQKETRRVGTIDPEHQAVAANGLRAYREAVGRGAP
jgi:hypothetical protein